MARRWRSGCRRTRWRRHRPRDPPAGGRPWRGNGTRSHSPWSAGAAPRAFPARNCEPRKGWCYSSCPYSNAAPRHVSGRDSSRQRLRQGERPGGALFCPGPAESRHVEAGLRPRIARGPAATGQALRARQPPVMQGSPAGWPIWRAQASTSKPWPLKAPTGQAERQGLPAQLSQGDRASAFGRQVDGFGKGQCRAVGVPKPMLGMNEDAQRRREDGLRPLRPALERPDRAARRRDRSAPRRPRPRGHRPPAASSDRADLARRRLLPAIGRRTATSRRRCRRRERASPALCHRGRWARHRLYRDKSRREKRARLRQAGL